MTSSMVSIAALGVGADLGGVAGQRVDGADHDVVGGPCRSGAKVPADSNRAGSSRAVRRFIHSSPIRMDGSEAWTASCQTRHGGNAGANDGSRTRDIQDHNLALYQLSYDRHSEGAV